MAVKGNFINHQAIQIRYPEMLQDVGEEIAVLKNGIDGTDPPSGKAFRMVIL